MASEIRVNSLTNRSGLSTVTIADTGAVVAGIVTATTFSGPLTGNVTGNVTGDLTGNVTGNVTGNITGNVTGNTSGTAGGLTGSPSITVTDITATGNVSIGGTLTYEDVTNIDSVGIITAQSDVLVGRNLSVTSGISTVKSLDYAAIDSTISDTAVDVFIYDTSKDSDGGAWRKRTQHTSWYNETLNTSTRGSRKEFPAVAVIVAESNTLTIYDGDDPDLPMWMVFNTTSGNLIGAGALRGVTALNGIIVTPAAGYTMETRFISDYSLDWFVNQLYEYKGNIEQRNDTLGFKLIESYGLVASASNDAAMTVLPNAPIDDATGLPVPTIAVATDSGISVIRDDGTIFDITDSNGARKCYDVSFTKDHKLMHTGDLGAGSTHAGNVFVTNILTADRAEYDNNDNLYRWYSTSQNYPRINGDNTFNTRVLDPIDVGGNHYAMADVGVSLIEDGTSSSVSNTDGMVAYITSDYNSGYQHGDIKGAFLSDTDTTNITGSELVTNGTFDSDTSNWTAVAGATLSVSSNRLVVTGDGSTAGAGAAQSFTTVSGKKYVLTYVAYAGSINVGQVRIGTGANAYDITFDNSVNSNAYDPIYFTATGTTTFITFGVNAGVVTSDSFQYDNISVRAVEEDRSVNNKGTAVYGTVTKSAVATGAELVAYSGFSGSNVLVQPYNSNLNPGTGNYSFMCWFKCPSTGAEQILMRRFGVPTVTGGTMMRIVSSSSVIQWYVRDTSSTATTVNSTGALDDGNWHCAVGTREGSTAKLYIDGELNSTSGCSANSHDPGTTADLVIGAEEVSASPGTYQNPADLSSLALVRYSLSAPSAAQVKKMYEDEKFLFQENAACTLYGSSDAVTALAYDDDTDLLHVGTSSGRSDFQGLRRINNTTTAVTTAITAQNEFIIEQ